MFETPLMGQTQPILDFFTFFASRWHFAGIGLGPLRPILQTFLDRTLERPNFWNQTDILQLLTKNLITDISSYFPLGYCAPRLMEELHATNIFLVPISLG